MLRGSTLFTFFLTIVSIVLLIVTLNLPFKAKLFPMIAILTAVGLLAVQVLIDNLASREKAPARTRKGKTLGRKHLFIGLWMAASFLMLWIIGFMGAVVFLPFLYLRLHKETWLLSITLSLGCGAFFYLLFGLVVKMPLYPGILGEKIWG
jgi:hypothetical protein